MRTGFPFLASALPLLFIVPLSARQDLTQQQVTLFQDPGGWEFITVTDPDSGIQTTHTCFDGHPHPKTCSGTLTFSPDNKFVKNIYIHGQRVQRHGTYQLSGNQLVFYDELGTRDGPYTIAIDVAKNQLTMDMPQVHIQLMLDRAYRDVLKARAKKHSAIP
ncbi:MAG: lipocalin family protein [Acidobacteriaceae bacterium]|nr:lipocalin family protein [Acidobacteriaceae bacterium]MBV9502680.1 lipocalin family protein [Acidobacteriaceae bacterium]